MKTTYRKQNEQATVEAQESRETDSAGETFISSTCPYCGYENIIGAEADTCPHFYEMAVE